MPKRPLDDDAIRKLVRMVQRLFPHVDTDHWEVERAREIKRELEEEYDIDFTKNNRLTTDE